ncbi:MAG: B12-binding domain-containing radical SAM protein [Desulfomonilaceae bacterium]
MGIKKITCIQLDGEFPDLGHLFVMPDYGLPLISTILSEAGYDVKVYVEHVKPPDWSRISESDLVCLSSFTSTIGKICELAKEIRSRHRIPIIVGGVYATYFPESCLEWCDYVVLGEGDETILDLVQTISNGGPIHEVRGIAYKVGDQVCRTTPRPGPVRFDTVPDYSLIQGYHRMSFLDILLKRRVPMPTVQSSRGCPFKCTFCISNTMFPDGYRKRDIDSVIRDMRDKGRYSKTLMFVDNDFTALRQHTKKLLNRIIKENLNFKISVFARVEVARDDELLSLMRQAGVCDIFQGFESVQPTTLAEYEKRQTLEEIVASVEKLSGLGFTVAGAFVLGADADALETISSSVNFALDHPITKPHFFPIWGLFPEKRSGYQSIVPWYRSIFRGWGNCDGLFVTNFPLQMPPSKLQRGIIEAYHTAYSPTQFYRALKKGDFTAVKEKLGVRCVWHGIEKGLRDYIPFLEELEDGLYDSDYRLREDVLVERVKKDPRWTFREGHRTLEALGLSPAELPGTGLENVICARA